MNTSTLMLRAKKLQSRAGAAAAMVIVPLAMAVPGRGDSVAFNTGGSSVIGGDSGATASQTFVPATNGVHLSGGADATLNILSGGGDVFFTWSGGFTGDSDVAPGNALSIVFNHGIELSGTLGDNTVRWLLNIAVVDSSAAELVGLHTFSGDFPPRLSGSGTGPGPVTVSIPMQAGHADTWNASFEVVWTSDPNYSDTLTVAPSIDLSVVPAAVPLPRAVWAGGALLGGLGLFQIRRRRNPAPSG